VQPTRTALSRRNRELTASPPTPRGRVAAKRTLCQQQTPSQAITSCRAYIGGQAWISRKTRRICTRLFGRKAFQRPIGALFAEASGNDGNRGVTAPG